MLPGAHRRTRCRGSSRLRSMYSPTRLDRESEIEIVFPKLFDMCASFIQLNRWRWWVKSKIEHSKEKMKTNPKPKIPNGHKEWTGLRVVYWKEIRIWENLNCRTPQGLLWEVFIRVEQPKTTRSSAIQMSYTSTHLLSCIFGSTWSGINLCQHREQNSTVPPWAQSVVVADSPGLGHGS